jgi:hypothetical protein
MGVDAILGFIASGWGLLFILWVFLGMSVKKK